MAVTDPTTARRIKVAYTGPFGQHTMLFHMKAGGDPAAFLSDVRAVLGELLQLMWTAVSFFEAFEALAGSPIFVPIASWTPVEPGVNGTPPASAAPSQFANLVGRASDGTKVALYLFETAFTNNSAMRALSSSSAGLAAVLSLLNDEAISIGTISGAAPVWKPYANVGQNDFITHRARRS